MKNVTILESGNKYGNMNLNSKFYPEGMSSSEIKSLFLRNRLAFGQDFGFDGHKMFMADQVYQNGSYFEITEDYVEANPYGWSDISEDILIVSDKVPGVVIGHSVADCPVVIMADEKQGVLGICHCSATLIDKRFPMMLADALVDAYGSKDEDISVYVGACAANTWTYDKFPGFVTDKKMWEKAIYFGDDGLFHIDMRIVLQEQFRERNVDLNVIYNMDDTITNPNYYSNSLSKIDSSKAGRHFTGAMYRKIR